MIYSIAKKSGSRREIKKINNIRAKSSKKTNISSSEDWGSYSSLASNIIWDKHIRPDVRKEISKLYHVVIDNLNNYNNKSNEAINSDPTFDKSCFNLSSGNIDPLPVLSVYLQGGKKHRATITAGITCLWESGATDSMIKKRHTKHY